MATATPVLALRQREAATLQPSPATGTGPAGASPVTLQALSNMSAKPSKKGNVGMRVADHACSGTAQRVPGDRRGWTRGEVILAQATDYPRGGPRKKTANAAEGAGRRFVRKRPA